MGVEFLIALAVAIGVFVGVLIICLKPKKDSWVETDKFEKEKKKLHMNFSEEEFQHFFYFIKDYKGGNIRRQSGTIVYQGYSGKEKGDLKGIFFNLVVPNPNILSGRKEEFRKYLIEIGVKGIEQRPQYETRDSKLKNRNENEEDFRRKEVGNKGEQMVRDVLDGLEAQGYSIINGPVLKKKDVVKEYDHIVVGPTGVFSIETKAFGMSNGESQRAVIFVDPGDKWILRKNQKNKELESPTEQVKEEKKLLQDILASNYVEVHSVLLLSNKEIGVKNNIKLPYDIVRIDAIVEYILNYKDRITENDKMMILEAIDRKRIN